MTSFCSRVSSARFGRSSTSSFSRLADRWTGGPAEPPGPPRGRVPSHRVFPPATDRRLACPSPLPLSAGNGTGSSALQEPPKRRLHGPARTGSPRPLPPSSPSPSPSPRRAALNRSSPSPPRRRPLLCALAQGPRHPSSSRHPRAACHPSKKRQRTRTLNHLLPAFPSLFLHVASSSAKSSASPTPDAEPGSQVSQRCSHGEHKGVALRAGLLLCR